MYLYIMIKYIYDEDGKYKGMKIFLGEKGLKMWEKVWQEEMNRIKANEEYGKVFQINNRRESQSN